MTSLLKKKPLDSPDKLTHDWYSNDSWPIYHRQLTDIPPTVDWYTTDSWPIYHRHMTDSKSRCVVEISTAILTDCRPTIDRHIDRLSTAISADCRPSSGRLSTECRPLHRPLSRSTLPTVNKIRKIFEVNRPIFLVNFVFPLEVPGELNNMKRE